MALFKKEEELCFDSNLEANLQPTVEKVQKRRTKKKKGVRFVSISSCCVCTGHMMHNWSTKSRSIAALDCMSRWVLLH